MVCLGCTKQSKLYSGMLGEKNYIAIIMKMVSLISCEQQKYQCYTT